MVAKKRDALVEQLREVCHENRNKATEIKHKMLKSGTTSEERTAFVNTLDELSKDRDILSRVLPECSLEQKLAPGFNEFHRFHMSYNMGYENANLSPDFDKGFPRVNLRTYRRYGAENVGSGKFGRYGFHLITDTSFTNSGEEQIAAEMMMPVTEEPGDDPMGGDDPTDPITMEQPTDPT